MKTNNLILTICLLLVNVCGFAENREVKGNGNIVSREIPITDYDAISLSGYTEFEYEQSDAAPYLRIELDENLFDYLNVKVEGKTLKIGLKKDEGRSNQGNSYNLNYTKFRIKSNSLDLKDLNTVGSGYFTVVSPLKVNKLEVNQAGSGTISFLKLLEGTRCEFNLAGSGTISISLVKTDNLKCSLAGSGNIQVKGSAERAAYSVAGSGGIKAFDCKAGKAEASMSGSGKIQVNADKQLDASIIGSGNIRYKGDPTLSKSVMGSGSVKSSN